MAFALRLDWQHCEFRSIELIKCKKCNDSEWTVWMAFMEHPVNQYSLLSHFALQWPAANVLNEIRPSKQLYRRLIKSLARQVTGLLKRLHKIKRRTLATKIAEFPFYGPTSRQPTTDSKTFLFLVSFRRINTKPRRRSRIPLRKKRLFIAGKKAETKAQKTRTRKRVGICGWRCDATPRNHMPRV